MVAKYKSSDTGNLDAKEKLKSRTTYRRKYSIEFCTMRGLRHPLGVLKRTMGKEGLLY